MAGFLSHSSSPSSPFQASLAPKQLYIYSKLDQLVDYTYVEEFAANQRSKFNRDVELLQLSGPHVQLQRSHPEEYNKAIDDFQKKTGFHA